MLVMGIRQIKVCKLLSVCVEKKEFKVKFAVKNKKVKTRRELGIRCAAKLCCGKKN